MELNFAITQFNKHMKVSDKKQIAITIEVSNKLETSNQIEISNID